MNQQSERGTASARNIVGRAEAIEGIVAQLAVRRFLTIVGVGGIGKTTVATAAAGAFGESWGYEVCFVDLAMLSSPHLLAATVGAALGARIDLEPGSEGYIARLREYLRDSQILIVLDNCEHVITAAAYMAEALLASPGVRILATSREPLRGRGEAIHHLASMACPVATQAMSVDEALSYGAVQLFVERARPGQRWAGLEEGEVYEIGELCRRLDGMPLAIELAAAQVGALGVGGLLRQLGEDILGLTNPQPDKSVARHLTIQATLDWSHSLLTDGEKTVLRRLSVFRGAFSLDSATRVATEGAFTEPAALEGLVGLASKSLISVEMTGARATYRLLETTRAYATTRLEEASEASETMARHAEVCCGRLARAEEEWQATAAPVWVARHRTSIDDVRAGIGWALAPGGDAVLGARLVLAALPLAGRLSLLREFVGQVQLALSRIIEAAVATPQLEFQLNSALGELLTFTYGHELATQAYARAHELIGQLGDPKDQMGAMAGMWINAHLLGSYVAMHKTAELLQARARDTQEPSEELFSHRAMAYALHYLGDNEGARTYALRALAHPLGNWPASYFLQTMIDREVAMRTILARTLWLSGHPRQAVEMAAESVHHSLSDRPGGLCVALALAACPIALWCGDDIEAEVIVVRLRDHASQYGMTYWLNWAEQFQRVLEVRAAVRRGATMSAPLTPYRADVVERDMLATLDEASLGADTLARAEQAIAGWCAPEILRTHGTNMLTGANGQGDGAALKVLERSLLLARFQGAMAWELRTSTSLAAHYAGLNRAGEARALLEPVYARFTEGHETRDLCQARSLLDQLAP